MDSFPWTERRFGPLTAWALGALLLALPLRASASLGGDVSSVAIDQVRMKGSLRVRAVALYTVHEIRLPSGTRVREYVSSAGTVFGVTWEGAFRPNLQQLLGSYFDEFQEAARVAVSKRVGRGPITITRPEFVVHMGGHPRAFFGRAYVPRLLPSDVSLTEIE
jgi:hypothetical protein